MSIKIKKYSLESIKDTLRFILSHPLNKNRKLTALLKFIWWQIFSQLPPYEYILNYGSKSKLLVRKGMTGATGNFYCGLHDYNEMFFLIHSLNKDFLFIDVGSNIGSYSILTSVETGCEVICFEPSKPTFKSLLQNIKLNEVEDKIIPYNFGLSTSEELIEFTTDLGAINHVKLENESSKTEKIKFFRFDDIIKLQKPTIVKIDVEGFETNVLNGMTSSLKNKFLIAIIIELNFLGKKYGFEDSDIDDKLKSSGFNSFTYIPHTREIKPISFLDKDNIIYIKDLSMLQKRIKTSKKFTVNSIKI